MIQTPLPQAIQIRGEPQTDPNVCRFIVDRDVFAGGSFVCPTAKRAKGTPLLEALFAIPGVVQVWVAGPDVTVQKASDEAWPIIGKRIGSAIRAQLDSGLAFVPPPQDEWLKTGEDVPKRIREILDTQVNPGVASHGGRIELVEVKGTTVYLKMSGGCQGCGSAQATLKQGVEKALRAELPEITEVIDVTDHGAGTNPYFAR